MKEITIKFSTCFLAIITLFISFCQAQLLKKESDMDTVDMAEVQAYMKQQRKEAQSLTTYFDSLFLEKEYKKIIEECERKTLAPHLSVVAKYNLIAAHYFAGDKQRAKSLVEKELERYSSGIGASTLLSENYTGYLYFLNIDKNWKYIEKRVKEIAKQSSITQKHTAREKEQQLFDFFLKDQKNRFFYDYTAINEGRLYKFKNYKSKQEFEKTAEQICKDIFTFYKKAGKLFSKTEIGELHYIQLVFLLHENDLKRREYYLSLLNNAVAEGVFPIDKKLDFLIVNALVQVDWENMNKVITEQENKLRKEYKLPNYKFSLVM